MREQRNFTPESIAREAKATLEQNRGFADYSRLECIGCHADFPSSEALYNCPVDSDILDVSYSFPELDPEETKALWKLRRTSQRPEDRSGVWRFRDLAPFIDNPQNVVTLQEGNTPLFKADAAGDYVGLKNLYVKHQGFNPTGSFKDPGMTAGISKAKNLEMKAVACASTGNTSASMAAYARRADMLPVVFLPDGQIAYGKLSQALDYGALTIQIGGDFDRAMELVMQIAPELGVYVVNSINPFRIEGQKTIVPELMEQLDWKVPDRIVVPGGNLGHASSIWKGLRELKSLGFIDKLPRLTVIQAKGADPLYRTVTSDDPDHLQAVLHPKTLATAIKIGNPISYKKALQGIKETDGWVAEVTEQEIADAKAIVGLEGIGSEPASAVTIAGLKNIVEMGTDSRIDPGETVVAVLTGNVLKDPDYTVHYHSGNLYDEFEQRQEVIPHGEKINSTFANMPIRVDPDPNKIADIILSRLQKA